MKIVPEPVGPKISLFKKTITYEKIEYPELEKLTQELTRDLDSTYEKALANMAISIVYLNVWFSRNEEIIAITRWGVNLNAHREDPDALHQIYGAYRGCFENLLSKFDKGIMPLEGLVAVVGYHDTVSHELEARKPPTYR